MRYAAAGTAGAIAALAALTAWVLHRLNVDLAGVRLPP